MKIEFVKVHEPTGPFTVPRAACFAPEIVWMNLAKSNAMTRATLSKNGAPLWFETN